MSLPFQIVSTTPCLSPTPLLLALLLLLPSNLLFLHILQPCRFATSLRTVAQESKRILGLDAARMPTIANIRGSSKNSLLPAVASMRLSVA
jgi:hypothetical protein